MDSVIFLQISEFVILVITALFFLKSKKIKEKINDKVYLFFSLILIFLNYYFSKKLYETGIESLDSFYIIYHIFFYLAGLQLIRLLWKFFK